MRKRVVRDKSTLKIKTLLILFIAMTPALGACGMIGSGSIKAPAQKEDLSWLRDGSITIARPAPESRNISADTMLGVLPVKGIERGNWLAIDPRSKVINVMSGSELVSRISIQNIEDLAPGTFGIIHKQTDPVWYAPATYFSKRNLPVPAEGTRERFRKGALGDFALFINKDLSIHNSPVNCPDVGGIKLSDKDMALLYERIGTDAIVEIY